MTRVWTAIGDSFTHGTGDTEGGWTHRTYRELQRRRLIDDIDSRSAPGLLIDTVIDKQTDRIAPSVVISAIAGANDIMQPHCDLDALLANVDRLLELAGPHGQLTVTTTCPDFTIPRSTTSQRLRERIVRLNDHVRTIAAADPKIVLVDAHTILTDPADWSNDQVHPNPPGHTKLAGAAVEQIVDAWSAERT